SGGLAETGVEGAEAVQRPGLTNADAELPVQGPGLLEVVACRPVPAQPHLDVAEGVQRMGFASLVAGLLEQGQGLRVVVSGQPVGAQPSLGGARLTSARASPAWSPACRNRCRPCWRCSAAGPYRPSCVWATPRLVNAWACPFGSPARWAAWRAWPWTVRA